MSINDTLKSLSEVIPGVVEAVKSTYGIVHKRETVKINGVAGFLVWDYLIWNEITFEDMSGNQYSFFNSISDSETERRWSELIERFGTFGT